MPLVNQPSRLTAPLMEPFGFCHLCHTDPGIDVDSSALPIQMCSKLPLVSCVQIEVQIGSESAGDMAPVAFGAGRAGPRTTVPSRLTTSSPGLGTAGTGDAAACAGGAMSIAPTSAVAPRTAKRTNLNMWAPLV